jgi:ComF family protein
MKTTFARASLERFLDIFFPDRCIGCLRTGSLFCDACAGLLSPYPGLVRRVPESLDLVEVAFLFDGPLRTAMYRLKYSRMRRVAMPLGHLLAARAGGLAGLVDAVMPIPLHQDRLRERGYNQAEELARPIAARWGLPLVARGLVRCRSTGQQARLSAYQRSANVSGAFTWSQREPPPPRILLVDDVLTTGATMGACADVLCAAGAIWVGGMALARSRPELDQ